MCSNLWSLSFPTTLCYPLHSSSGMTTACIKSGVIAFITLDLTNTLPPPPSVEVQNRRFRVAHSGITFRPGYRCPPGLPGSRGVACGSHAAVPAVLTMRRDARRAHLPVGDLDGGANMVRLEYYCPTGLPGSRGVACSSHKDCTTVPYDSTQIAILTHLHLPGFVR